jgi:hypothetical protein
VRSCSHLFGMPFLGVGIPNDDHHSRLQRILIVAVTGWVSIKVTAGLR